MTFNSIEDAKTLMTAMKGAGTDEATIIRISAGRTNKERLAIISAYKKLFGKDLLKAFQGDLRGHFYDTIIAMYTDPIDFDCEQLRRAMKGIGSDDDALLEIIVTRSQSDLTTIISRYSTLIKRDLLKDVASETKGPLKKILLSILKQERSNNLKPDKEQCNEWVKALMNEEEKKWEKEGSFFWKMLIERSPAEVLRISRLYYKNKRKTVFEVIEKHFGKKEKHVARHYMYASINTSEYFSMRIKKAIKGLGTKDHLLIRILVTRDEVDMPVIRAIYNYVYKLDMLKDIKGDTSGNYQKLLMEIASH